MFEAIDSETPMLLIKPFSSRSRKREVHGTPRYRQVIWNKDADIGAEIKALLSDDKAE